MRVILDTNVLLSAVMRRDTPPARLLEAWRRGRFTLASCETQLDELREVSRRPSWRKRLRPTDVGTLGNEIGRLATMAEPAVGTHGSPNPGDDYLLGLEKTAQADFLMTGDKNNLLAIVDWSARKSARRANSQVAWSGSVLEKHERP